jgi:hypothetical protein
MEGDYFRYFAALFEPFAQKAFHFIFLFHNQNNVGCGYLVSLNNDKESRTRWWVWFS